jgi:hypothetical protein
VLKYAEAKGETMLDYLNQNNIVATRQTEAPINRSRTGYGRKVPTSWQIQLTDKRWRRVYMVCFSNAGSAYICTKQGKLWLGSFDPAYFKQQ